MSQAVLHDRFGGDLDKDELRSPIQRRLLGYWLELKERRGALPSRSDIDPTKIPETLPFVLLVDVLRPGPDFRFRLIGHGVIDRSGFNATGATLAEARFGDAERQVRAEYEWVAATGAPHLAHQTMRWAGRDHIVYDVLKLPLAADGRTVDMILVGIGYHA